MDRDLGIQGFLTSTPGVGGILKASAEDFVVDEVSADVPSVADGAYTIARIRVREWETNRLIRQLSRNLHISRRRIGFAGTKDKRALTTQLFSFEGVPPESLRDLGIKDVEVLDAFPSSRGLQIGDLVGNAFRIVVRDLRLPREDAADAVAATTRQLGQFRGFPNFFGVQRFGSIRPVTHDVGRHLVRGEFREAVETYAANPIEGEDPESFEVREALARTGDIQAALRDYPRTFTFEKALLSYLATHPGDHIGALRVLPLNLLIMFVHAYQAVLYNRILSERMRRGIPIHEPIVGDLVLPADRRGLPDRDRAIDVTEDNLERVVDRCRESKAWVSAILFGSETAFAEGEMGEIERGIVTSEGLRPKDFIIPEIPRISSRGTRREILAPFRSLEARVEDDGLRVSVELTRGAYATCLLREYMKSE
jgi:tRNA pseudouridine13 synthase